MPIKNKTPKCRPSLYNGAAKDFVADALANKKWFRGGPPPWPGAPTTDEAVEQTAADIKRLRRSPYCEIFPGAVGLADRMEACCEQVPCGVCARCIGGIQRAAVARWRALVAAALPGMTLCTMTIIFPNGRVPLGDLSAAAFPPLATEFMAAISHDKNIISVEAGLDVSCNDDSAKGLGVAYQLHVHGTCVVENRDAVTKRLSAWFPKTAHVYRPVVIEPCDGSAYSLSYGFKTKFYRRVAFWATKRARPCWQTCHRSLSAKQQIELMLALADLGSAGRLLSYRRNPAE